MRLNYIYNFSYVDNENESYFVYTMKTSTSTISRFFIDYDGKINQVTWLNDHKSWFLFWSVPRRICQVYNICGGFGTCNEDATKPLCECVRGFKPRSQRS